MPTSRNSMRHSPPLAVLTSIPHLHLPPGDPAREPRRQAAHGNPPSPIATTGSHEWGRRWGAALPGWPLAGDGQGLLCLPGTPASSDTTAHSASLESRTPDSDTFLGKQHLMSVHSRFGQPPLGLPEHGGRLCAREEGASSRSCSPQTLTVPRVGAAPWCPVTQPRDTGV